MKFHIPPFEQAQVLVIGDCMLDRYWFGNTERISPEAPVPVVQINQSEERPGGAANVALNVASLGGQVTLCGICGYDEAGEKLEKKLQGAGVTTQLFKTNNQPTIVKLRILSLNQQLMRLDFEEQYQAGTQIDFLHSIEKLLPQHNLVVLSDYNKGTLKNIAAIIQLIRKYNLPILVDPKGNDFSRYQGVTILTPNRKEFEAVVGQCQDEKDFIERGLALIKKVNIKALLVTRGAQGMTLIQPNHAEIHYPARAREVYDVTGAGDTVIGVLAAALSANANLEVATGLANRAASIAVAKLGTASVSLPELRRAIFADEALGRGIMTEEQLLIAIADAKAQGEKIVFTNGCFDILHAGHVAYLEQAKALGNRLIVAVNDDASVSRLKGNNRPINPLMRRMAVLAGLNSVDWVVQFPEDTPERLIRVIQPDILVKGGDYRPEQIVGRDIVEANNGKVIIVPFVPNCSTTQVINKIHQKESIP